MLLNSLILILTVAGMEIASALIHRYVMHGFGWGWHRSHHEPHQNRFELNDLYAVVFAAIAIVLIALGTQGVWPLQWIGAGMTAYGMLYFIVHDGLVHKRWPFRYIPRRGYLQRLYQAHRLHHAVKERERGLSFGFLYAPPTDKLKAELRRRQLSSVSEDAARDARAEDRVVARER
ncbi:sterol desaturase family protein [Salinicola salarius]|uniref:sterol desaturase family protein n=1 Tax=Salinicola salarius TaxID=430457 RepID=UPI00211B4667|nr:sterol desaturase family protein [Salinicola salarius]